MMLQTVKTPPMVITFLMKQKKLFSTPKLLKLASGASGKTEDSSCQRRCMKMSCCQKYVKEENKLLAFMEKITFLVNAFGTLFTFVGVLVEIIKLFATNKKK